MLKSLVSVAPWGVQSSNFGFSDILLGLTQLVLPQLALSQSTYDL